MWPFRLHSPGKSARKLSPNHRRSANRLHRSTVRLALEALEDRVLLTAGPAYFVTQGVSGGLPDYQLYMGTPSGNTLVKDFGDSTISDLTITGNIVYFVTQTKTSSPGGGSNYDNQLWVSNGTSAGTRSLYSIDTSTSSNPFVGLTPVGNNLEFEFQSPTSSGTDTQLWVSNGSFAGTQEVFDAGASAITLLPAVGSKFYFITTTTDSSGNMEDKLYVSDGKQSGTVGLATVASGTDVMVGQSNVIDNQVCFIVSTSDSSGNTDYQLWTSNGTSSGTVSLADTTAGMYATMYGLQFVDGRLVFVQANGSTGDTQLWKTDGTQSGTKMVFDVGNNDIDFPTVVGSNFYFVVQIPNHSSPTMYDENLYVSDLTTAGTKSLQYFKNSFCDNVVAAANQAFVEMEVYTSSSTDQVQLLAATLSAVTQVAESPDLYSMAAVGNQLYFTEPDSAGTGAELYVTNGTPSTTDPVYDFTKTEVTNLIAVGSQAFIFTQNGAAGSYDFKMYASNGTSTGTVLLADLGPNLPDISSFGTQTVGSQLYVFTGPSNGGPNDYRVYTSDGTPAGTTYQDFGVTIPKDLVSVQPAVSYIGAYYNGTWYFNTNGHQGAVNRTAQFGFAGALPVVGNWGPNGTTDIGAYYNGTWYFNTSGGYGAVNKTVQFGFAGALPVVGNWGPNGSTDIGAYYNGTWYFNTNGDYTTVNQTAQFGFADALPVVGNWGPNGSTDIGVYYNGTWYFNTNGDYGAVNKTAQFGFAGALPVVGNWGPSGSTDIGAYYNGTWYFNTSGGYGTVNKTAQFGFAGALAVVGNWPSEPLLPQTASPLLAQANVLSTSQNSSGQVQTASSQTGTPLATSLPTAAPQVPTSSSSPTPTPSLVDAAWALFFDGVQLVDDELEGNTSFGAVFFGNSQSIAGVEASIALNSPYAGALADLLVRAGEVWEHNNLAAGQAMAESL